MRAHDPAAQAFSGNDTAPAAVQHGGVDVETACFRTSQLIIDYFSRGSSGSDDEAGTDVSTLDQLFDEIEAMTALVASLQASTLVEIGYKRALQRQIRPHRDMLYDLSATIGRSIDADFQVLTAKEARGIVPSQGSWLGWPFSSWKQSRLAGATDEASLQNA